MNAGRVKIITAELAEQISRHLRANGSTLGICHGCFDIIHSGHIHYLKQAAQQVDVLLVSVTAAEYVNKGPGRPVFDDEARMAILAELAVVDYVVLNRSPTATGLLRRIGPDFYFKGADYTGLSDPRLIEENAALRDAGGELVLTDGSVSDSSTRAARVLMATEIS